VIHNSAESDINNIILNIPFNISFNLNKYPRKQILYFKINETVECTLENIIETVEKLK